MHHHHPLHADVVSSLNSPARPWLAQCPVLYIVAPRCDAKGEDAQRVATGHAAVVLSEAVVVETLAEALADVTGVHNMCKLPIISLGEGLLSAVRCRFRKGKGTSCTKHPPLECSARMQSSSLACLGTAATLLPCSCLGTFSPRQHRIHPARWSYPPHIRKHSWYAALTSFLL